jgi:hypothetical protein
MSSIKSRFLFSLCVIHGAVVFIAGFLLFVTKWFPYGTCRWMREWLYRFF